MTNQQKPLYKVTASLLNSWGYMYQCDDAYSLDAYESFLKTLKRIKEPPNFYMQRGIDFETSCVNNQVPSISPIIADGEFQYYAEKDLQIDDLDIRILGYLDVLKAGTIYDIKRVSKYAMQKYFKSYQHHMYFALVPEANDFIYLIAQGYSDNNLTVYKERYVRAEAKNIEDVIIQFFNWLKQNNLFSIYLEHWQIDREKKGDELQ